MCIPNNKNTNKKNCQMKRVGTLLKFYFPARNGKQIMKLSNELLAYLALVKDHP